MYLAADHRKRSFLYIEIYRKRSFLGRPETEISVTKDSFEKYIFKYLNKCFFKKSFQTFVQIFEETFVTEISVSGRPWDDLFLDGGP